MSIRELLAEGQRMLAVAEQLDGRIDVYQAVCQILRISEVLEEDCKQEAFKESMLEDIREYEFRFIQLEYYLMNYDPVSARRYQDRSFVTKVYRSVVNAVQRVKAGESLQEDALGLLQDYSRVADFLEASKHLVFTVSDGDREFLNCVYREAELDGNEDRSVDRGVTDVD